MWFGDMNWQMQQYNAATGQGGSYGNMQKSAQDAYSGILKGYQQALAGQAAQARGISQGYQKLRADVAGGLANAGATRRQEIQDYYNQKWGGANQDLINRGLGNTTVASSVQRGFNLDEAKAYTDLSERVAGQKAQYDSQLGLAGLGYRGQANRDRTALLGQSLGYQADWQRSLLGASMRQQNYGSGGGYGRGGGGYDEGRSYTDILRPATRSGGNSFYGAPPRQYYGGALSEDPWIDTGGFSGGGGGGGGGGDIYAASYPDAFGNVAYDFS